jgi:hypothetical protein
MSIEIAVILAGMAALLVLSTTTRSAHSPLVARRRLHR